VYSDSISKVYERYVQFGDTTTCQGAIVILSPNSYLTKVSESYFEDDEGPSHGISMLFKYYIEWEKNWITGDLEYTKRTVY
jgi:hypothetical protein